MTEPLRERLTYCGSVHPGETLAEVLANLRGPVAAVALRHAPGRRFPVSLWLPASTVAALDAADAREQLAAAIDDSGLRAISIDGRPFGRFNGEPVKEQLYRPDWREPQRLAYTERLGQILAELLPPGGQGSISTLPGGSADRVESAADHSVIASRLLRCARALHLLRERTDRTITLALEPEPMCLLETTADAIRLFEDHLLSRPAVAWMSDAAGGTLADAEALIRRHLGVCYDSCHAAVEFEHPVAGLDALARAGIRVPKVQLSAGLQVRQPWRPAIRRALVPFARDLIYLHPVVERRSTGRRVYPDLVDALAGGDEGSLEWRIHCHVPIFRDEFGLLQTTQEHLRAVLASLRHLPEPPQLEIETRDFTPPPRPRPTDELIAGLVRELRWAEQALA